MDVSLLFERLKINEKGAGKWDTAQNRNVNVRDPEDANGIGLNHVNKLRGFNNQH